MEKIYFVTESELVARQREGFLEDRDTSHEQEQILLDDFLKSISYRGLKDQESLRVFFEDQLTRPLSQNRFAHSLGTISEPTARARNCELCSLLLDERLWRIVGADGENDDAKSYLKNPTSISKPMHDDSLCYLHPIWPTSKVMWHDHFTTANELCVVRNTLWGSLTT